MRERPDAGFPSSTADTPRNSSSGTESAKAARRRSWFSVISGTLTATVRRLRLAGLFSRSLPWLPKSLGIASGTSGENEEKIRKPIQVTPDLRIHCAAGKNASLNAPAHRATDVQLGCERGSAGKH